MKQALLFLFPAILLACFATFPLAISVRILAGWASVASFWVAAGYLGLGTRIFGKRPDGTVSPICLLVLAPYTFLGLLGALIARYVWGEAAISQLSDRFYFGRRLLGRENGLLEERGVVAVLDLTGAFPEPKAIRSGRVYRAITLLDTTSPPLEVLQGAVRWLTEHAQTGPVYVHCAMGHGRAGLAAGAWLLAAGEATDVDDAIRKMQNVRPLVRLSSEQRARLEEFAESITVDMRDIQDGA